MDINLAHLREKSVNGGWIDFAVFDAKSISGTKSDNQKLLSQLTTKARLSGLKIDQSALVFKEGCRIKYFGSRYLVEYLSNSGISQWTHKIKL